MVGNERVLMQYRGAAKEMARWTIRGNFEGVIEPFLSLPQRANVTDKKKIKGDILQRSPRRNTLTR